LNLPDDPLRRAQLVGDRTFAPFVPKQLLLRPGAAEPTAVPQHPDVRVRVPRLRFPPEEQHRGDRDASVSREPTSREQPCRVGMPLRVGVRAELPEMKVVHRRVRYDLRLVVRLPLVEQQLTALVEGEPAVLVADAKERLVAVVGVHPSRPARPPAIDECFDDAVVPPSEMVPPSAFAETERAGRRLLGCRADRLPVEPLALAEAGKDLAGLGSHREKRGWLHRRHESTEKSLQQVV
jgi:hypothetical protein